MKITKLFENKFEEFVKECKKDDNRTFLQRLFIRSPKEYWNSGNRKSSMRLFFRKGFNEGVKNNGN